MNNEKYYTKAKAAEFLTDTLGLPVATKTLSKYITIGGGPVYKKFGKRVVYHFDDLNKWAFERLSNQRNNSSQEVIS